MYIFHYISLHLSVPSPVVVSFVVFIPSRRKLFFFLFIFHIVVTNKVNRVYKRIISLRSIITTKYRSSV